MIVPMKKIFLLLLDSEKSEALKALSVLGAVHLESLSGKSNLLDDLIVTRDIVQRSITVFPDIKESEKNSSNSFESTLEIAKRILKLNESSRQLSEEIVGIRKELDRLDVWGDFSPSDIISLKRKGVNLGLYELKSEELLLLPDEVLVFPIKTKKKQIFAVLILPENIDLPELQEVSLPDMSISELSLLLGEKLSEKENIESEMLKLSRAKPALQKVLNDLDADIEFESVRSGLNIEGPVAYLSGYLPEDVVPVVKISAEKEGWGLLIKEPEENDLVPTLIKNNKAVRIIQPVFDLFGILPGYHERDISFFFLVFLSIFFAMIVGDGGYGLVFFSIAAYFGISAKKKSGKIPDFAILIIIMSSLTIIWGAITGTWFGSKTLSDLSFLKIFTIAKIANFTTNDTSSLIMYICFIFGVIHISIAHIWNFVTLVKKGKVLKSLAQVGWLSIVVGLYFYVLNFVLNPVKFPVPYFAVYMILGGVVSLLIFSEQEGNFFKGILNGFANIITIFFGTVGAFADIISYIRLFAVGLATLAVASSFNGMAANAGHGVIGIIGSVVILILGHGLNFAMSTLAIVVHGVRLNVLEFSGHLGMEWSGIYYNPFRNRKKEKEGET